MDQVMIDLETMSTDCHAAICSIGAVKFNLEVGIKNTFYCTVDLASCKAAGLHISKDTVEWWSKQNPAALKELRKDNISLSEALDRFDDWYGTRSLPTWGMEPALITWYCIILTELSKENVHGSTGTIAVTAPCTT